VTQVGAGGIKITRWSKTKRFHKDYEKLTIELRDLVDQALQDLSKSPFPLGLRFEKLKGYSNPDIYTVHITGNSSRADTFAKTSGIALLLVAAVGGLMGWR